MRHTYKDQLDGFFALSSISDWMEENKDQSLTFYSIVLNFGNDIHFTKDFASATLVANEICCLPPGTYISDMTSSDDKNAIIDFNQAFYCLELHDKDLACNGLLFGAIAKAPKLVTTESEAKNNYHLMDILREELEHNDENAGDMLKLLLKRLIIKCVRLGREQFFKEAIPKKEETDIIRQYQALVEKHFRSKHKVGDYAELLFKSPKTLSNTFKKLHNKSPLQIIQDRVVLEAKRLMYYTDKPIKEITYELGFSEPAQFSRLFKKVTNFSPSEFKEQSI